jgi:hypothetical protein
MPQTQDATGETASGVKKDAAVPPCGIVGAPHGPQMETWGQEWSGFGVLYIGKHQGPDFGLIVVVSGEPDMRLNQLPQPFHGRDIEFGGFPEFSHQALGRMLQDGQEQALLAPEVVINVGNAHVRGVGDIPDGCAYISGDLCQEKMQASEIVISIPAPISLDFSIDFNMIPFSYL